MKAEDSVRTPGWLKLNGSAATMTSCVACSLLACNLVACNAGEGGAGSVVPDAGAGSDVSVGDGGLADAGEDPCQPQTCEELGIECGRARDGCGGSLDCGPCEDAGSDCQPSTCEQAGAQCGALDDGCGEVLDCGECSVGACGEIAKNRCFCDDAEVFTSTPRTARRARSAGFPGSTDEYFELYDIACGETSECVDVCESRGGSEAMCGASECAGFQDETECLPPPIWRNVENILFESNDVTQAVQLTAVFNPYKDTLLVDDFQNEIPDDAQIVGITMEIRRAGESAVADFSVRLLKGGEVVGGERANPQLWGDELEWVSYGGAEDLWGESWDPEDLNSDAFGLALSTTYTRQAGNARASVDQVRVTVHYVLGCEG